MLTCICQEEEQALVPGLKLKMDQSVRMNYPLAPKTPETSQNFKLRLKNDSI